MAKQIHRKIQLEPENFYVLRTPLLPRTQINELVHPLQETRFIRQQLSKAYQNPALLQALYLASPDLFKQLAHWQNLVSFTELSKKNKKELQELDRKFLMFFLRAAYRCTPFGTFAAVTTGEFKLQRESSFKLDQLAPMHKSSRLDMVYLLHLKSVLEADTKVKEQLRYFPNNTLYKSGDDMLCSFFDEKALQHVASSKGYNETAWDLFETCQQAGGLSIRQMIDHIIDPEITEEDCREFIDYLIEHHLLISELYPSLNGDEYLTQLQQKIAKITAAAPYHDFISRIQNQLAAIDQTTNSLEKYQQLLQYLIESPEATQFGLKTEQSKEKELVQVDAFKALQNQELSKTVARDITRKIETLLNLPTPDYPRRSDLTTFKKAFFKRYENESVPLLQVMDEVIGLGYPYGTRVAAANPHLKALGVMMREEIPALQPPGSNNLHNPIDHWLQKKYVEALQSNQSQINLTAEDIKAFQTSSKQASDKTGAPAMVAMGKLLYAGSNDLLHDPKNGNPRNFYFQLYHVNGPTIGNLMGRFCHGSPELKNRLTQTIAQLEPDSEEVIYAEVDHLPGQRVGNVIIRPRLRPYSILLGGTHTSDAQQIPVSDLWVSMPDGKNLVLRSQKLNKQVIPRMSNAHNYSHNAHPLYKFLCDLQHQQTYQWLPSFFRQNHWQQRSYLPRLVYDNLILSPQRWLVDQATLEGIGLQKKEDLETSHWQPKIAQLQEKLCLPPQVLIVESDNKLYVDFANPLCIGVFLQKVFAKGSVELEEVVETQFPSQAYSNEMIFPIMNVSKSPQVSSKPVTTQAKEETIQKNFALGSEWLYFKIYLGTLGADRIIMQQLYPLSEQLKKQGLLEHWFFIRYTDADYGTHLRWRLKVSDMVNLGTVMQAFTTTLLALQNQQQVSHYVTDTYQRELSRYQPFNIASSEQWFALDSWFVCHALYLMAQDETSTLPPYQVKLALALQRIQALLQAFDLSDELIRQVISQGKMGYSREFGFDKHPQSKTLKDSLTKDYLEQVIRPALKDTAMEGLNPGYEALWQHLGPQERTLAQQILANLAQHSVSENKLISLLGSYIHMFVNRFFSTTQRFEEMWLYWGLDLVYSVSEQ